MAEYIDKQAFLNHMKGTSRYFNVKFDIENFPAADVAQVVHGRWEIMDGTKTRRICSKCGWDVPEYGKFYSYCPNCGAKMDGGAEK